MSRIRAHGADLTVGKVRIHVRTLPPNTTSEIQPCDQGLIAWLKARWRQRLDEISMAVESAESAAGFAKKISIVQVMRFLSNCARAIEPATGRRYWARLFGEIPTAAVDEPEDHPNNVVETLVAVKEKIWAE